MESLAFIHAAMNYEDPNPDPELVAFEDLELKVSGNALMGIAGAAVAASVLGGAPAQVNAAPAPVAPGSSGESVQSVQKALGVEVDGQYGKKTEAAVMDFQIRQGLKEIDGVVGKETATALGLDENYRPVGFVDTRYGVGLNIRGGPGLGYYIVGGASEGSFVDTYEDYVYNDGYEWRPLATGGWAAVYDNDLDYSLVSFDGGSCGDYYEDVSYDCGDYYDNGYYEDVSYDDYYDYEPVSYRRVSYRPRYGGVYYYPVSYGGGGCSCGCN